MKNYNNDSGVFEGLGGSQELEKNFYTGKHYPSVNRIDEGLGGEPLYHYVEGPLGQLMLAAVKGQELPPARQMSAEQFAQQR